MKRLVDFIYEQLVINEGGMGGHMAHPFDYTDFTCNDLIELINSLFSGKIETMKEKLDGTNIQATVNLNGDTVFIRNKGDLNSEKGGMSIEDMANKWSDKPSVANNYINAGKIISSIFKKIPVEYFNPDEDTKVIANCECITAGQTNVMLYNSDRVAFHGVDIYKKSDKGWECVEHKEGMPKEIERACQGIEGTTPRPNLVINSVQKAEEYRSKFINEIKTLFNNEGFDENTPIEDWKKKRFKDIAPKWITKTDEVFQRWFNQDKSVNLKVLKQSYPDHIDELVKLDKGDYRICVQKVMEPLDELFLNIGNAIISICNGFTNQGSEEDVVKQLRVQVKSVVDDIQKSGSTEVQDKLETQLNRMKKLGDVINSAEGVVFTYKGRLMKLTGSFAPLNQILGSIKFSR